MEKKVYSILKSSLVELLLIIDEHSFFMVRSDRKFSTCDVNEAVREYHLEVARLRVRALQLLENRPTRPWQNVISRCVRKPK